MGFHEILLKYYLFVLYNLLLQGKPEIPEHFAEALWPQQMPEIQLNTSLLNMKLPKNNLVGGYVGLVVGARWGALREGMHFSQSKNARLLIHFL